MFSILKEQINAWVASPPNEIETIPDVSSHAEETLHVLNEDDFDLGVDHAGDPQKEGERSDVGAQDVIVEEIGENRDEAGDITIANLQTKAFTHAKLFGNYLYSTAAELGIKFKKTMEEFNKAQDAFLKELANKRTFSGLAPWVGCRNEDEVKGICLSLSSDRRNFFRCPPEGVDFEFDYESMYPIATAIMEYDASLIKMRYELVPKLINEKDFWRNYFYRVYLVCRANGASFMPKSSAQTDMQIEEGHPSEIEEGIKMSSENVACNEEDVWEAELEAELLDYESNNYEKIETITEDFEEDIQGVLS